MMPTDGFRLGILGWVAGRLRRSLGGDGDFEKLREEQTMLEARSSTPPSPN
jgi:hypothetical protein